MQAPLTPSNTQTIQLQRESLPVQPILSLRAYFPAVAGLSQAGNIPKRANDLVHQIIRNDLFTAEQKTFANSWEAHFIQILSDENPLIAAKALCFLGIKVITPALVLYQNNRLACDQLKPIVRAQRELLALVLPENADVEEFIIQREEVYSLMIETSMKLNQISALNRETVQLMCDASTTVREKIISNSNQSSEMLRELAQQWRSRIGIINTKLTELTAKADLLNKKFQNHSHDLQSIGTQLAVEQQVFHNLVEDFKHILKKG